MMKRTSLRVRLLVIMICLTTLPVLTVTTIATYNTRQSVEKEMINANNSRMQWADQYLDELIEQLDTLFYTLQINPQLMAGLTGTDSPDISVQYRSLNNIREAITSQFYTNSRKVDELTLYMHDQLKAISVDFVNSGSVSPLDICEGPWSRLPYGPVNMYFKQNGSGIYAYHGINRFEDHRLLGGIGVRINQEVWEEVSHILQSEDESSVFLLNDEGELLSGSSISESSGDIGRRLQNLAVSEHELEFRQEDGYFFFMKKVADGQLTVVKAIPLSTVAKSARPTIAAGFLTGGLFMIASILLSILFSMRITRPIVSLAVSMRKAHVSNFEQHSVQSRDEIGLLERGYNSMMERIRELIEVEYRQELEVKNAQLLALQAQINPHFLNNTLQLIGGMALSRNADDIYNITRVIGDLLRYSISNEGGLVKLEEELKHVRNYVFIQENRFLGRCSVVIEADEFSRASLLPRFTLQPLVENAFEHGLQPQRGHWKLLIRIRTVGSRTVFMVKDEGVGMTPERLEEIRAALRGNVTMLADPRAGELPRRRKGIGLHNVHSRLVLQFGEKYGMRIYSKDGAGTLVVIQWPAAAEGGERNAEGSDY